MTVHYGYNYKQDLIKKMKVKYSQEIDALNDSKSKQLQLDEAQGLIFKFFEEIKAAFGDLEEASKGALYYREFEEDFLVRVQIETNYIQFNRRDFAIEIEIGLWNEHDKLLEVNTPAYVIPGEKRCRLKKVGKVHDGSHFDENAINSYVRMAFSELWSQEGL
jgi:hypothetical protein